MKITSPAPNVARLTLAPGERLHHRIRMLRSQALWVPLRPHNPAGAALARLYHGVYWMACAQGEGAEVELTGDRATGAFVQVELAAGERLAVDLSCLAAVSVHAGASGAGLKTALWALLRPAWWAWGHPVGAVVCGPATALLYGDGLREAAPEERAFALDQLRAFDPDQHVEVVPLSPRGLAAQLYTAASFDSRVALPEGARAVIQGFRGARGPRQGRWGRLAAHLLWTGLALALAWALLR
jgi:hypothetical protein